MNSSMQQQQPQSNISRTYSEDDLVSDIDPMLQNGTYKVVFFRQCPFQIRQTDSQGKQTGRRDILNVRIVASPSQQSYHDVKIQLTSQTDLYFVYECRVSDKKYERIKKVQSLNFPFANLIPMLIKLLNLCDKFHEQYTTVLYMSKTGTHQLKIFQNIEYKSIELLSLQFQSVQPQVKKQFLAFRFSLLKAKNQRIQAKTKQMLSLVKLKNPNLLQSLAKKTNATTMSATMMLSRINKSTLR